MDRMGGELTSNGAEAIGVGVVVADGVAIGAEAPVALGAVGVHVGDGAGVLGVINETEVVDTSLVVPQVRSEEGRVELRLDGVEEGGLSHGRDWTELVDGNADGVGLDSPVLMELKARPRRPSLAVSSTNSELTELAASTACLLVETSPTVTVSRYTSPLAELPSP